MKNECLSLLNRQVHISNRCLQWLHYINLKLLHMFKECRYTQRATPWNARHLILVQSATSKVAHFLWQQQLQAGSQKITKIWNGSLWWSSGVCISDTIQVVAWDTQAVSFAYLSSTMHPLWLHITLWKHALASLVKETSNCLKLLMLQHVKNSKEIFDKHTRELIGFTNLDDINKHLHRFEQRIKSQL